MAEPPLVDVQGLCKRFGERTALESLAFALEPGRIHGFVGANGGGKTTALRILAGILRPDSGGGSVMGLDLQRRSGEIRGRVGYMAQRLSLYADLPVRENLRFRARVYGLPNPRAAVEEALADFGLQAFARTAAGRLSGGWARRLQLAAALIHRPRLVLLDEPSAGLDAVSRQDVWRRIGRLAADGVGVVVSTHDLAEAERCSSASFFVEGRIRASGTPDEIARRAPATAFLLRGPRSDLLGLQVDGIAGVVASYPQGGGLRIVADASSQAALGRLAASHGATLECEGMRLEDAALVFSARQEA